MVQQVLAVQLELGALVRVNSSFAGGSARDFLPVTYFHYCAQLPVFLLGWVFLFLPLLNCFPLPSLALTLLSFSVCFCSLCHALSPRCVCQQRHQSGDFEQSAPGRHCAYCAVPCAARCFRVACLRPPFPLQEGTYFLYSQYITGHG